MQLAEVLNEFPPDLQAPVQHLVTVLLTQIDVPHIMVAATHVPPAIIPEINAAERSIELLSATEEEDL